MPFVIVSGDASKTVPATLCEANLLGKPDQRRGVPILMRQIDERILLIEPDDRREIVSTVMRDGVTQFAIEPSQKDFAASVRLARLAKASELLEQLRRILTALPADNGVLDHVEAICDSLKTEKSLGENK